MWVQAIRKLTAEGVRGGSSQFGSRCFFLRVGHVFLVRALEVFDPSALEMPDPRRHFLDQVVIVRHQQYRALRTFAGRS